MSWFFFCWPHDAKGNMNQPGVPPNPWFSPLHHWGFYYLKISCLFTLVQTCNCLNWCRKREITHRQWCFPTSSSFPLSSCTMRKDKPCIYTQDIKATMPSGKISFQGQKVYLMSVVPPLSMGKTPLFYIAEEQSFSPLANVFFIFKKKLTRWRK